MKSLNANYVTYYGPFILPDNETDTDEMCTGTNGNMHWSGSRSSETFPHIISITELNSLGLSLGQCKHDIMVCLH